MAPAKGEGWLEPSEIEWIKRIKRSHKVGLLTDPEKDVLVRRAEGETLSSIGLDMMLTRQRIDQISKRAEAVVRTGKRPKRGRPAKMPDEYVIKLTQRQKDALGNKDISRLISWGEEEFDFPYWTHCLMIVLDQIAEQNNKKNPTDNDGLFE
tara:strand:- start:276 stop:731 length:456 start_codon:yes stop_codon:yes gene_type:complete